MTFLHDALARAFPVVARRYLAIEAGRLTFDRATLRPGRYASITLRYIETVGSGAEAMRLCTRRRYANGAEVDAAGRVHVRDARRGRAFSPARSAARPSGRRGRRSVARSARRYRRP